MAKPPWAAWEEDELDFDRLAPLDYTKLRVSEVLAVQLERRVAVLRSDAVTVDQLAAECRRQLGEAAAEGDFIRASDLTEIMLALAQVDEPDNAPTQPDNS